MCRAGIGVSFSLSDERGIALALEEQETMMSRNAPHREDGSILALIAWFALWAALWLAIVAMVMTSGG